MVRLQHQAPWNPPCTRTNRICHLTSHMEWAVYVVIPGPAPNGMGRSAHARHVPPHGTGLHAEGFTSAAGYLCVVPPPPVGVDYAAPKEGEVRK